MVLGPNGIPISGAGEAECGPGKGVGVQLAESTLIRFPAPLLNVRFVPGRYIIIAEQDLDRMILEGMAARDRQAAT